MKRRTNWVCVLIAIFIFTVSFPIVSGAEYEEEQDITLAPYFIVEGGDALTDSFPLKETKVSTSIDGVIADTYVVQTYANEGENPINADYIFPASAKVTVHGMKMEIGDRVVTARIKEKEEAREEFKEAKSEGKSASLLEQQRPNVFHMNVVNIMPGDTVKIELHYTELIVLAEGTYEFVFPTVVGPRYEGSQSDKKGETGTRAGVAYMRNGEVPSQNYEIDVKLSAGVPIGQISSKSHKIDIVRDKESEAHIRLSDQEKFPGDRDFILEYKLTGSEVNCGLMLNTGETENFFLLMVQPPERIKAEDIVPREYIFVLDVSGSMFGYPLNTAKALIRDLVTNLRETDTFNLILFSGGSQQLAPRSVAANEANIKKAVKLIDNADGGGGTELAPALKSAVAMPKEKNVSRSVVVITDGYISNEKEIFQIIDDNLDTTSFFSFGIGSSVNRYLIDGIANAGLGEAFIVTEYSEAEGTAGRFRSYIESPVLTDIQVEYQGFEAYDAEPVSVPTLFAQKPIVVFGKWKGEPSGVIRITGKTGGQDYIREIAVGETEPMEDGGAIGYLWARKKVERLTDYSIGDQDVETVRKEVTAIGLEYSMMTPYTSFISVVDTVRNPGAEGVDVSQPLPLPSGVSGLAAGNGYTSGSEPGFLILLLAMGTLGLLKVVIPTKKRERSL